MSRPLKPWAYGPFEVLMHAEMHFRLGEDLDRRIAMIGFDNAIEVAITTYLNLYPIQRANRAYPKADVEKWLENFHTKVDFFFAECSTRTIDSTAKKDELVWFHEVRNGQYHNGGAAIPQRRELDGVCSAAVEIFSVLFGENDVLAALESHIAALSPVPPPAREDQSDRLIDNEYGMIEVCGQAEYVSDILYALDPTRYHGTAMDLRSRTETDAEEREPKEDKA